MIVGGTVGVILSWGVYGYPVGSSFEYIPTARKLRHGVVDGRGLPVDSVRR